MTTSMTKPFTPYSVWLVVTGSNKSNFDKLKSTVWIGFFFAPPPDQPDDTALYYATGIPISDGAASIRTLHFRRNANHTSGHGRVAMIINGFINVKEAMAFGLWMISNSRGCVARAARAYILCQVFSELYTLYADWSVLINVDPMYWRYLSIGQKLFLIKKSKPSSETPVASDDVAPSSGRKHSATRV